MTDDDGDEADVTSEDGACEGWANCQPLTANDVIQQLGEKQFLRPVIRRALEVFGANIVQLEIYYAQRYMHENPDQPRTLGGIFLYCLKHVTTKAQRRYIFKNKGNYISV